MLTLIPDLRVVEVANSIAPAYAGRLLADLGAEVIALEPPGGSCLRTDPHAVPNLADFLGANKLSATLDFARLKGDDLARALCARADVIIYDGSVPYLNRALLQDRLYEQSDAVLSVVTPWGLKSPYGDLHNDELLLFALSGIASVTPEEPEDEAGERPMQLYGHQAQFAAGLTTAVASLQGWFAARASGESMLIDIAVLDALTSMPIISQAAVFAGHALPRGPSQRPQTVPRGFVRCREGYVYTQGGDDNWPGWAKIVARPDWEQPPFSEPAYRQNHWAELATTIQGWLDQHTNAHVYNTLQQRGITAFPVNSIGQVTHNRQIVARDLFRVIGRDSNNFAASATPFRLLQPEGAMEPDVVHRLGADLERVRELLGMSLESAVST